MLDFSASHILILLVVALVVIGPKDLPKFMRMIGQSVGKMRRLADQFRASFEDMARQSELEELRKEIAALRVERDAQHPPQQTAESDQPYVEPDVSEQPLMHEPLPEPILPDGATPAEPAEVHVDGPSEAKSS